MNKFTDNKNYDARRLERGNRPLYSVCLYVPHLLDVGV